MPLTVVRRRSTGALTISGTVAGQRVQRRAQSDSLDLAAEEAAALEADILRTAWHGERRGARGFAEAVTSYLATRPRHANTLRRLNRLLRSLGDVTLGELDQEKVNALHQQLNPTAGPATVLREIVTPLRSVLHYAARQRWCDEPMFETLRQPQGRTLFMMPAEADKLVAASALHLKPLVVFLLCTGARLSEAIYLDWRDVDLEGRRAIFWETKNGSRRVAVLPRAAQLSLAALSTRTGRVFLGPKGNPYADRGGEYGGQVKTAWRTARDRAGLDPGITPHTCRHTWATWHYAVHRDLLRLKVEGGWSSTALVERYAHLMPVGNEAAIRLFWEGETNVG